MATSNLTLEMPVSGSGYCKFPDGTMICYGTLLSKYSGAQIAFAQTFYSEPTVNVSLINSPSTSYVYMPWAKSISTGSFYLKVNRTTGGSVGEWDGAADYSYVAVGRWKA